MENQRKIATLSFAESSAGAVDLWAPVNSTGSYAGDNDIGRSRADELIQYMSDNQAPPALGFVTQAIIQKGVYGPMEIGFFSQVALFAMRGNEMAIEPKRPKLHIVSSNNRQLAG